MAPNWMPQNIQKRLLLYILQQLSLFSEIDLSNLEVSLGSSSQVTLSDVEIDTDAIQIPGVYLRNGKVKSCQLTLNVSGGVTVEADGLLLTVAVSSNPAAPAQKSKFSLSQSTMDLAQSIIQDEDFSETNLETQGSEQDDIHDDIPRTNSSDPQPSALNNMVSKAVEAALSRLQVSVKNISLRIIMDQATLDVEIKEAKLSTQEGVRTVVVSGLMVLGVTPTANPGEQTSEEEGANDKNNGSTETTRKDHEDTVENQSSDSESDDDDFDPNLMASSVLERSQAMTNSLVYSKEEASSIYMSAASDVFESRRHQMVSSSRLAFITDITVTFAGLTDIENLNVEVGEVKIAASPIPLTLLHIIESFSAVSSNSEYVRSSGLSPKTKGPSQGTQAETQGEKSLVDKIVIKKVLLNLVSAINESGSFFKPHEASVCCDTFSLRQVDEQRFYGSIKKLTVEKHGSSIGAFDSQDEKNDIRFEFNIKTSDFTLLLGKDLTVDVDQDTAQRLINLSSLLPQVGESLAKQKAHRSPKKVTTGTTTVQTSLMTINLKLSDRKSLKLNISPVSFDSKESNISLKKVAIYRVEEDTSTLLVSVLNISHKSYPGDKQLRTYDNNGHEVVLLTHGALDIESVELSHNWNDFLDLLSDFGAFKDKLNFVKEDIVFKTRKKARISSNLAFQTRLSVGLLVNLKYINFKLTGVTQKFGDIVGKFETVSLMTHKEGYIQIHSMKVNISRELLGFSEPFVDVINPDDRSAPVISLRTRDFMTVNILLRNSTIEYYTKWLSIFDSEDKTSKSGESSGLAESSASDTYSNEPKMEIKLNLVDVSVGLNPGRLLSKANLVIPSGKIDALMGPNIMVRSDLRGSFLVLIDDIANIANYEETKANRSTRASWSQVSYFNAKGYSTIGKFKDISINVMMKKNVASVYGGTETSNCLVLDINLDLLEIDLCADSSHCLIQLINDLKQPITIKADVKYKTKTGEEINVFDDIDQNAFTRETIDSAVEPTMFQSVFIADPLEMVEGYYDQREASKTMDESESDILDKDLDELHITDETLKNNPYFAADDKSLGEKSDTVSDLRSENSDSIILFNNGHFGEHQTPSVRGVEGPYPVSLNLTASKVIVKIHDGYDWKYTRKTISNSIKRLEQKAREQKERLNIQTQQREPNRANASASAPDGQVLGETLFDSIHVAMPITSDPALLTAMINKDIQSKSDDENSGIDVGKRSIKKLKLRRSKTHKVLIELNDVDVDFTLFSNQDPTNDSSIFGEMEYETVSELNMSVRDFEVTDNVPTSTWNKFVTYMKDEDREGGSRMLTLNMKIVRPVTTLAATDILMDVHVLPLRLHVDQDTLEVLTRFGEFKDARFALVDEFEDLAYIQKFNINSVHIKLDYKPKKIDYAGLRSGHTTEFMNSFILDEADMVLKALTLYGISGFPRLGQALNGLWMPDIKSTQLSGVLTGLAPVRSIAKIGSGFKDLVAVPVKEYRKDGRFYRSFSKGVQQFSKTTTNEMIKLGVKLAAGTQAILEHTEETFGGTGAAARSAYDKSSTQQKTKRDDEDSEDDQDEDDGDDDNDFSSTRGYGVQSHLIGRGNMSSSMMHRSVYQPTLESIADINQQPGRSLMSTRLKSDGEDRTELLQVITASEDDNEGPRMVSLYADQPTSIKEGFLLAYDSLGRNLLVAKDAILNAGTEIGESGSAHDTTLAVMRATPVVLLRPIIGATEATSRALLGINNHLDPSQRRYTHDKYKQTKK